MSQGLDVSSQPAAAKTRPSSTLAHEGTDTQAVLELKESRTRWEKAADAQKRKHRMDERAFVDHLSGEHQSHTMHDRTVHGHTVHGHTVHGRTVHGRTVHDRTVHYHTLHHCSMFLVAPELLLAFSILLSCVPFISLPVPAPSNIIPSLSVQPC
ncbi:hypothetical protein JB92DRAFT_3107235 [Gautieria morchelliformis]|nr:hypothetical protein JB92DRAFT_3107235 [Gautieria morchelliformis]